MTSIRKDLPTPDASYHLAAGGDDDVVGGGAEQTQQQAKKEDWYKNAHLAKECEKMLDSREWQSIYHLTRAGVLKKLDMMKKVGLPDMLVLPATKLMELGRIPRSNEGHAITAREAIEQCGSRWNPIFFRKETNARFLFLSHKWKRPDWCEQAQKDLPWDTPERIAAIDAKLVVGDPDGAGHEKALALIEWTKWFLRGVDQNIFQERIKNIYFWIDWPCVDQENPGHYMVSLPAYVATCHHLVAVWSDLYEKSAWCGVERMMAYSFMAGGSHILALKEDFVFDEEEMMEESRMCWWTVKRSSSRCIEVSSCLVPNPFQGSLTNVKDKKVIKKLRGVASRSKVFSFYRQITFPGRLVFVLLMCFLLISTSLSFTNYYISASRWPLDLCIVQMILYFCILFFVICEAHLLTRRLVLGYPNKLFVWW